MKSVFSAAYQQMAPTQTAPPQGWTAQKGQWVVTNDGNGYSGPAFAFVADVPQATFEPVLRTMRDNEERQVRGRRFLWSIMRGTDDGNRPIVAAVAWLGN
jgi:hypothetical protein